MKTAKKKEDLRPPGLPSNAQRLCNVSQCYQPGSYLENRQTYVLPLHALDLISPIFHHVPGRSDLSLQQTLPESGFQVPDSLRTSTRDFQGVPSVPGDYLARLALVMSGYGALEDQHNGMQMIVFF